MVRRKAGHIGNPLTSELCRSEIGRKSLPKNFPCRFNTYNHNLFSPFFVCVCVCACVCWRCVAWPTLYFSSLSTLLRQTEGRLMIQQPSCSWGSTSITTSGELFRSGRLRPDQAGGFRAPVERIPSVSFSLFVYVCGNQLTNTHTAAAATLIISRPFRGSSYSTQNR